MGESYSDSSRESRRSVPQSDGANESAITLQGKEGKVRFRGLKELVLIYDGLEDGAEIEWHEMELIQAEVDELLKNKNELHAFNPVTKSGGS